MKNNSIIIMIVIAIVVGAVAFYGGMKYQQTKVRGNLNGQGQPGQGNRQGRFGGNGANRPVMGQILSLDDKSITVKLMDGTSKIVVLPDNVTINKTDPAAKTDLKTGENVGVFGTSNSDGTVTAQSIQLNPMLRGSQASPSAKTNQ